MSLLLSVENKTSLESTFACDPRNAARQTFLLLHCQKRFAWCIHLPVVEVHRGGKRVLGVHHGAQAAREERHPLARRHPLGPVCAPLRRGRQSLGRHGAIDHGERAAGFFEHVAVSHDPRNAAAAVGALPHVFLELPFAVELLFVRCESGKIDKEGIRTYGASDLKHISKVA